MPKYYCDYCDVFLTHDSKSARKIHNNGRKHREMVRGYYQKWMEDKAQKLIDSMTKKFVKSRNQQQQAQIQQGFAAAAQVYSYYQRYPYQLVNYTY